LGPPQKEERKIKEKKENRRCSISGHEDHDSTGFDLLSDPSFYYGVYTVLFLSFSNPFLPRYSDKENKRKENNRIG
jgi:hypothetical protein